MVSFANRSALKLANIVQSFPVWINVFGTAMAREKIAGDRNVSLIDKTARHVAMLLARSPQKMISHATHSAKTNFSSHLQSGVEAATFAHHCMGEMQAGYQRKSTIGFSGLIW